MLELVCCGFQSRKQKEAQKTDYSFLLQQNKTCSRTFHLLSKQYLHYQFLRTCGYNLCCAHDKLFSILFQWHDGKIRHVSIVCWGAIVHSKVLCEAENNLIKNSRKQRCCGY